MMNPQFTLSDFAPLSPLLLLLSGALSVLLLESFFETVAKKYAATLTFICIALALLISCFSPVSHHPLLTPWLQFDTLSRLFNVLFMSVGLGITLLSSSFFRKFDASRGEYHFLLLAALFGLILIGSSADFLTLFLGLETLSISLYILCGYMKRWHASHEASMKYFILGSLSTAFLVYGIALIYGASGGTRLDAVPPSFSAESALFYTGIAFVTLSLAFKAAIVPFHVWAPDVYDGAPTPVTAFMAIGTKMGAFAAFIRVFMSGLPHIDPLWNQAIAILAMATLIYGNFVALRQTHLRRFFAYSGISHAGFLLIALVVGTPEALSALLFYLIVYSLATFGSFSILTLLDTRTSGVTVFDIHGLFRRSPILAGIFSICLLTLAGIPPTVGFLAKFYLFKLAFEAGHYVLVVVALLTTILSAVYYLKIIAKMLSQAPGELEPPYFSKPAMVVGAISFSGILTLSCYPRVLDFILSRI